MAKDKGPVKAQEPVDATDTEEEQPQPQRRVMPLRIEVLELEEGAYEGWKFSANRNFTFGEMEELASLNYIRMRQGLRVVVTGWENFVDRDGNPIPFVPKATLDAEQTKYTKWLAQQEAAKKGGLEFSNTVPMLPPEDPWDELTTDLIYTMARAVLGLPLPNK